MKVIALAALSLIITHCSGPAAPLQKNSDSLTASSAPPPSAVTALVSDSLKMSDSSDLNGTWYLIPVLPSDTAAGRLPEIKLDVNEKRFIGTTGCNRMGGIFRLKGHELIFDKRIMTTKVACPGYNEEAFLHSLLKVDNYVIEKDELLLRSHDTILSRWSRKPMKASRIRHA